MEHDGAVGLVLAGGGARGAYEAGVLSVLLPLLEAQGRMPTVLVGTSVGAINAAHLAANVHRGAEETAALLLERWRSVRMDRVLRRLVGLQAARTGLAYMGEVAGLPGVALHALLDPAPLERTLDEWIDWRSLHRNVRSGAVRALGVVATSAENEDSVVFLEGQAREQVSDSFSARYVPARIRPEHVRASAAIPTLFPAVQVEHPAGARGWYFDGGTRLNTPIKPAIDIGVDRVAVVATHSILPAPSRAKERRPDFADGALELVQATLVDPLIEDVRMLGKINLLAEGGTSQRLRRYRGRRGRGPYRQLPYVFVSPPERRALGRIALEVMSEGYSGIGRLRSPDLSFVGRLVGGRSEQQGELLSYLFFEADYAERLIERGRMDAQDWLGAGGEEIWRLGPIEEAPP